MDWHLEQQWMAHCSAALSYHIRETPFGKYLVSQLGRFGMAVNTITVGEYDTLEEAQAACEDCFAEGGLKEPILPTVAIPIGQIPSYKKKTLN